ncbi:MAG: site-2 protease family protein [Candidatus Methanomethylophilaceae archaeon]
MHMDLAYIILIILVAIYIPLYLYVRKSEKMHAKGIVPYGPTIMIKTRWGLGLMDRLSRHRRFWNAFGLISKIIALLLMVIIVFVMVMNMLLIPSTIGRSGIGIEYALAIPGLNPMLPLVYGVIGLVVAMAVHELAHGIQTRANGMRVKSSGLLYAVVPVGAFVEPDDEDVGKADRKARMDLYAAGIATNFIVAALCFLLMVGAMSGGLSSEYGDNPAISSIEGGTFAYESGIPAGALITHINGAPIATMEDFRDAVDRYDVYNVTYIHEDSGDSVDIPLGVRIAHVSPGTPASDAGVADNMYLLSMRAEGGAWVDFGNIYDFMDFMGTTMPGDVCYLRVTETTGGSIPVETQVTLDNNKGIGFLGVSVNTSGFMFTTPNENLAVAMNPVHGATSISEGAMSALSFIGAPLSGYAPIPASTQWWYDTDVLPQEVFWVLMSILFWIFWLNLVLGLSNALPAIPFDGGFLFMGGLDFIMEKAGMPAERREHYTRAVTGVTTWIVFLGLMLVMMAIIL